MFSEVFYVGLYTTMVGFILAISNQLYKSKCKTIKCWGCEINRDVEAEEKIDELEIEKQPAKTDELKSNNNSNNNNI